MAAVMLAGAPLCNEAYAQTKIEAQDNVADNVVLADGVKFIVKHSSGNFVQVGDPVKVDATGATYVSRIVTVTDADKASVFEVTNFQTSPLGATFELKVNGQTYALSTDTAGTGFDAVNKNTAKEKVFTSFTATSTNGKYTVKGAKVSLIAGTNTIEFAEAGKLQSIKAIYDAEGLKEVNQSSTSFSFGADAVEGNIFQELTPQKFDNGTLKGTIFVKGSADDIKKLDWTKKETAAKVSVAYVKNETWGLNTSAEKNGEGYKLVMINGAEFFAEKDAAKWNNAVFTNIVEADQLNNEGEIDLTIKPIFGTETTGIEVNIAAVKTSASDTKTYVTTVATSGTKYAKVIKPTLGDNTYFAASEFLSAGKSVYNVYFTSGKESVENGITTEFHKYLAVTSNGTDFQADALAANDVQLNSPFAQWIATGFDGKYTLTLTNRQTKKDVVLKLKATDTAGVYEIVSTASSYYDKLASLDDKDAATTNEKNLATKKIKLVKTTVTKTDGYLDLTKEEMAAKVAFKFSGKSNELGKTSFYAVPNYTGATTDTYDKLYPSQDENKIAFYNIAKTNDEVLNVTNYAYLNADNQIVTDAADTLQVPVYNIAYSYFKKDAKKATVAYVKDFDLTLNEGTGATKQNLIFPMAMNGSYTITLLKATDDAASDFNAERWATNVVKGSTINFVKGTGKAFAPQDGDFSYVTVMLNDNKDRTSLEAASRHATFEAVNVAGAVSMQENKKGILEGIVAAEPATFW